MYEPVCGAVTYHTNIFWNCVVVLFLKICAFCLCYLTSTCNLTLSSIMVIDRPSLAVKDVKSLRLLFEGIGLWMSALCRGLEGWLCICKM